MTLEELESLIAEEAHICTNVLWTKGKTTIYVLRLRNGFEVIGTSAVVDVTKFDENTGIDLARENAIDNLWKAVAYMDQQENHNFNL